MKHFSVIALTALIAVGCSNQTQTSKEISRTSYTKVVSKKAFSQATTMSNEEFDIHVLGKSFFTIPWVEAPSATTARDGLGPLFSANTCIHCHPNNGAGLPQDKNANISRALVMRLSLSHSKNINNALTMKNGFIPEPTYGGQLSLNGTSDTPYEGSIEVKYKNIEGKYDDGGSYSLQEPTYEIKNLQYGAFEKNINIAPHIALALVGLGEIEQINDADILANEDSEDKDGDGISGKANWVYSPESKSTLLGRFTWKASAATVKQQSANAAHNDMGLSNPLYPKHNCTDKQEACQKALEGRDEFDLPMERLNAIAFYLKTLKIPLQRVSADFEKGKKIFKALACNKCHVESFVTEQKHTIHPYSDFLLHDMGDALSDGHSMFKATPNEFRTPPLWGIGLYKKVSGETALLHDGRARSIEEAILWHGGEAKSQAEAFKALTKQDRDFLVTFLKGV